MAAGVGKTYRMLQEGHAEADAGRDVAIGYLEPHKREETSAQARGLEVVPRRRVTYPRRRASRRWTCRRCCARAPELALIDELAHTNAPGLEHEKRYEDIADVLAAGIDVFSTVNVQHLESLNDQVAELTGVRVRETVPDSVLGERRRGGPDRPHPRGADRAPARRQDLPRREHRGRARTTSSRIENLAALREVSLRQVAEERRGQAARLREVEPLGTARGAGRRRGAEGGRGAAAGAGPAAAELAAPGPPRLALGAAARHRPRPALGEAARASRSRARSERQVTALRRLASVLGANFLIEEHDDLVAAAARVVRERGTTYIMVGESEPRRGLRAPARAAAAAADAGDPARGRRADRRPPRRARRRRSDRARPGRRRAGRSGSAAASCSPARGAAAARGDAERSTRSSCRSPAPRSPAARSTPRCASPGPRTRR